MQKSPGPILKNSTPNARNQTEYHFVSGSREYINLHVNLRDESRDRWCRLHKERFSTVCRFESAIFSSQLPRYLSLVHHTSGLDYCSFIDRVTFNHISFSLIKFFLTITVIELSFSVPPYSYQISLQMPS